MARFSFKHQITIQLGICVPQTRGVEEKREGTTTYVLSLSRVLKLVRCKVLGFPAVAHSAGRMKDHFMFRHFQSRIVVVQEVKELLPHCNLCRMHMPSGENANGKRR